MINAIICQLYNSLLLRHNCQKPGFNLGLIVYTLHRILQFLLASIILLLYILALYMCMQWCTIIMCVT